MVPLGTVAAVEDVAAAVVFLASPAARMITAEPSFGRRLDCGLFERLRRIRIHFPLAVKRPDNGAHAEAFDTSIAYVVQ